LKGRNEMLFKTRSLQVISFFMLMEGVQIFKTYAHPCEQKCKDAGYSMCDYGWDCHEHEHPEKLQCAPILGGECECCQPKRQSFSPEKEGA